MKKPPLYIKIDDDLVLRQVAENDAPALFAQITASRQYLREWLPWLDMTRSVDDELAFIQRMQEQYATNGSPTAVIHYRRSIAGSIGYHLIDWANLRGEIGYWLGEQFQGHGLMTRSCEAMVRYGFEVLGLNKIEIRCATGNARSRAIPRRLGFTQEGIIRQGEWLYNHYVDLELYGLLASEWRARQIATREGR